MNQNTHWPHTHSKSLPRDPRRCDRTTWPRNVGWPSTKARTGRDMDARFQPSPLDSSCQTFFRGRRPERPGDMTPAI